MILCIETSTTVCSVSLTKDGKVIASRSSYEQNSHSKLLGKFVDSIFKQEGISPSQLTAVAVSKGPGSYTGLRIGVSLSKGLSYALNKPLISIDTLQIMAVAATQSFQNNDRDIFCPMIDARRMEVYTSFFDYSSKKITTTKNLVITGGSFAAELQTNRIIFFGDGATKCESVIKHKNAIFLKNIYPLASNMAFLAYKKHIEKKYVDTAYFEPFYLKSFIATTPKKKVL